MLTEIVNRINQLNTVRSLKDVVLVRMSIQLCTRSDMIALLENYSVFRHAGDQPQKENAWKILYNKTYEEVSHLCIPETLKSEILDSLSCIKDEILTWIQCHSRNPYLRLDLPCEFCWTMLGEIDKKRTAEAVVKNESSGLVKRYKLACIYCLKEDLNAIWEAMDEVTRKYFVSGESPEIIEHHPLVRFWTFRILQKHNDYPEDQALTHGGAFRYATIDGNKAATEFLYQELSNEESSNEEKQGLLMRSVRDIFLQRRLKMRIEFPPKDYHHIFYFLISHMDEGYQVQVFQRCARNALECFLEWPRQIFFMDVVSKILDSLKKQDFPAIFLKILIKIIEKERNFNYKALFAQLWGKIPVDYRAYIRTDTDYGGFFLYIFIEYNFPFILIERNIQQNAWYISKELKHLKYNFYEIESDREFLLFLIYQQITTEQTIFRMIKEPTRNNFQILSTNLRKNYLLRLNKLHEILVLISEA